MVDTCVPGQVAAQDPGARYALGSVLSHVLLHQTIIGEEALLQLAKIDETPDLLVRQGSAPAGLPCTACLGSAAAAAMSSELLDGTCLAAWHTEHVFAHLAHAASLRRLLSREHAHDARGSC